MNKFFGSLKKYYVLLIIIAFGLLLPFVIMWLAGLTPRFSVSGNTSKEQTWITFAGSYIGALIGAAGAVIIMYRTINEGRRERIESRKYQDFLYFREKVEEFFSAFDAYVYLTISTLNQMQMLFSEDFKIPDIKQWNEAMLNKKILQERVIRALKQTTLRGPEDALEYLENDFGVLSDWDEAWGEYLNLIIINNDLYHIVSEWGSRQARDTYTDRIYKYLVMDIVMSENYKECNGKAIQFSFSEKEGFNRVLKDPDHSHGETKFSEVHHNAIMEYKWDFNGLVSSVRNDINCVVSTFKEEVEIR